MRNVPIVKVMPIRKKRASAERLSVKSRFSCAIVDIRSGAHASAKSNVAVKSISWSIRLASKVDKKSRGKKVEVISRYKPEDTTTARAGFA